jgi:hypothetical protein
VKLLRSDKDRFVFQLSRGEKAVLLEVLKRYPCVPPAHRRLSRVTSTPKDKENQRLLDEALAEQRAQNKRQLRALLNDVETLVHVDNHWGFHLRRRDFEWLIQVLNDVRVGSWLALGSPEELPRKLPVGSDAAPHVFAMELAGLFQMTLLEAAEGGTGI